ILQPRRISPRQKIESRCGWRNSPPAKTLACSRGRRPFLPAVIPTGAKRSGGTSLPRRRKYCPIAVMLSENVANYVVSAARRPLCGHRETFFPQQVPIRLPLVCTRSSLRAGSPLRSLALRSGRDDRIYVTLEIFLQVHARIQ